MTSDFPTILGTAVTVSGAIAGAAVWAFRSVVAGEVTPALVELRSEAAALAREFAAFREVKEQQRTEMAGIVADLHRIVQDHEVRLAEHAMRLSALEPTTTSRRSRPRRT